MIERIERLSINDEAPLADRPGPSRKIPKWAGNQNSSTAPEAEGLPLNIPSKGIVDQACLINYAGCDENLKCAGCPTLFCLFV